VRQYYLIVAVWGNIASLAVLTTGCVSTPLDQPTEGPIMIVDARTAHAVYPCANVSATASTLWHFWQDPCKAKFSLFRTQQIQVMTKPGEIIRRAPYKVGEGLFYIERHETSSNIIFAPGFNPARLGDGHFWEDYHRLREQDSRMDVDFLDAEESIQQFRYGQGQLTIAMIPLRSSMPDSGTDRIAVDHSMLVFLLGLDDVWTDLRRLYNDQSHKKAVVLVCKTIEQMAMAHREKWPMHKWNGKQQRVIDWCHSIAAVD